MSRRLDDRLEALVRRLHLGRDDCPSSDETRELLISMIPRARQLESRDEMRLSAIANSGSVADSCYGRKR